MGLRSRRSPNALTVHELARQIIGIVGVGSVDGVRIVSNRRRTRVDLRIGISPELEPDATAHLIALVAHTVGRVLGGQPEVRPEIHLLPHGMADLPEPG